MISLPNRGVGGNDLIPQDNLLKIQRPPLSGMRIRPRPENVIAMAVFSHCYTKVKMVH